MEELDKEDFTEDDYDSFEKFDKGEFKINFPERLL
jgi:hypothetical protein